VPGLVLEADTPEGLLRRIVQAAPELIADNLPHLAARAVSVRPVFDDPLALAA